MQTNDFDYDLPEGAIASAPVRPRDHSRLLVLNRSNGKTEHRRFFDIGTYLKSNDLLILNDTKVFRARLRGRVHDRDIEVFLLRPEYHRWKALMNPAKIASPNDVVQLHGVRARVISKNQDGTVTVDFGRTPDEILQLTDEIGEIPVPPYIKTVPQKLDEYQTVYAKHVGSVAAPTAGFHFTPELIESLKANGITCATITLHVGIGTFRPMKTDLIEEHVMHEEWIDVPDRTRHLIQEAKAKDGRVIAVGTTTTRALESGIDQGFTNLFVTPGFEFKIIDGLITNFHLPKSTLLVLVSAFAGAHHHDSDAGRNMILHAYKEAINRGYRFYSFGDAMLIF